MLWLQVSRRSRRHNKQSMLALGVEQLLEDVDLMTELLEEILSFWLGQGEKLVVASWPRIKIYLLAGANAERMVGERVFGHAVTLAQPRSDRQALCPIP